MNRWTGVLVEILVYIALGNFWFTDVYFQTNRIHESSHGDWLLMSYLVSNMNPAVGAQFLDSMDPSTEVGKQFQGQMDNSNKLEAMDWFRFLENSAPYV